MVPSFFDEQAMRTDASDVGRPAKRKAAAAQGEDAGTLDLATRPAFTVAQTHRICQENNFFLTFYNSTPFKDLVELIHPVLETITFQIVDRMTKGGQPWRGIVINSMDAKKVSMIVARLRADLVYPEVFDDQEFCVASDTFANFIKTFNKACNLEIRQEKGSNNVIIRGYNPNRRHNEQIMTIPTIDKKESVPTMDLLNYTFVVDIDLPKLRNMTRVAQNSGVNAENINLKILEYVNDSGDYKITKVCVELDGGPSGPSMSETFRSKTKWTRESKQTVITTSEFSNDDDNEDDDAKLQVVFDEKFSTKYLHMFFKSMDRPVITLMLSPDRPLVITYLFDGGESVGQCRFILAPIEKHGPNE